MGGSFYKDDINTICNGLDLWTHVTFHATFKNLGRILPIGTQDNEISCGVCVLNALGSVIFVGRLFTRDGCNTLRVQYPTDILELLLNHVSIKRCGRAATEGLASLVVVCKKATQDDR